MHISRLIEILEEHIKTYGDGPVEVYNEYNQLLKVVEEVTPADLTKEPDTYGTYNSDEEPEDVEKIKGLIIWPNEH